MPPSSQSVAHSHQPGIVTPDAEPDNRYAHTLAATVGADGIAVSAVAPGLTDTPSSRTVNTDEQFEATVDRQALKQRLTPDDTAVAVAYLASDAAAAMTGQVLCADGGLIMR
jgi:NAD(P)-dependent dehydrogenase (short-subunit alcohol dehydrogenase family)